MKINMILKKANSTTRTTSEISKCYKDSMLSDAQNAGKLLDFNFFLGEGMPPDPLEERGLVAHITPSVATYNITPSVTTYN